MWNDRSVKDSSMERFLTPCWNPQLQVWEALPTVALGSLTHAHTGKSTATAHSPPSHSSGGPRCLPFQDRGTQQMPCHPPGTVPPALGAPGLTEQVAMAAGDGACRGTVAGLGRALWPFRRGWLPAKAQALLLPRRAAGWGSHGHTQSPLQFPRPGNWEAEPPLTLGVAPAPGTCPFCPFLTLY